VPCNTFLLWYIIPPTTVSVKTKLSIGEFRRAVAKLKREGLIPPNKRGRTVNPKTAQPYERFGGKSLKDYIADRDNQQVIRGEATTIARSRVSDTQGFAVKKPKGMPERVVVPLPKDAKVSVENKNIVITHTSETGTIKRTSLPRTSLKRYLRDAESLPELGPDSSYAFYFFGNKSHRIFKHPADLVEYLTKYDALKDTSKANVFRNFEIVTLNRPSQKQWLQDVESAVAKRRKYRNAKGGRKKKIGELPLYKQEIRRKQKREQAARHRERERRK